MAKWLIATAHLNARGQRQLAFRGSTASLPGSDRTDNMLKLHSWSVKVEFSWLTTGARAKFSPSAAS